MRASLNHPGRHMAMAASCFILFVGLSATMQAGAADPLDTLLRQAANGWASAGRTAFMAAITHLGSVAVIASLSVAAAAILWSAGQRQAAWNLALVMAGSALLESGLKIAFHRMRPEPFFGLAAPESYSFPSGHAFFSACLYAAIASILAAHIPRKTWRIAIWSIALGLIVTIGFSRIYLGVHYPTDVLGGFMAAGFWVASVKSFAIWRHRTVADHGANTENQ